MKLRIVEPGWEGFTGNFGGVEFVDGLSVDSDVSAREAGRVASTIRIETEDGKNPSVSQLILDMAAMPMSQDMVRDANTGSFNSDAPPAPDRKRYTQDELMLIADTKGINGLREIGAEYDVRDTSIVKLIDKILIAQDAILPPAKVEGDAKLS